MLPCMNRIVAVIEDSKPVTLQGLGKLFDLRMVNSLRQQTPFLYGLLCPCPGPAGPDVFEFVLEDHHCIDDFVQLGTLHAACRTDHPAYSDFVFAFSFSDAGGRQPFLFWDGGSFVL